MTSIYSSTKARAQLALPYLKTMRETFSDPTKWTRGVYARRPAPVAGASQGATCDVNDPKACCWCVEGLTIKLTPKAKVGEMSAFDAISMAITDADPEMRDIVTINDNFGYEAVLEALDRAIAKCEKDLL